MGPIFAVAVQATLSILGWMTPTEPSNSILIADVAPTSLISQPVVLTEASPTELVATVNTTYEEETPVLSSAAVGSDLAIGAAIEASLFYAGGTFTGAFAKPEAHAQATPEPGTYLALAGGFGLIVLRRRRR